MSVSSTTRFTPPPAKMSSIASAPGGRPSPSSVLRLRQACCDKPAAGQTDTRREPSSKLQLMQETLETAIAEGHKALVFSQWTSSSTESSLV
ncbi:MAG: hypothetical protein R3C68_13935 [Myxococcota bacterium]